MEFYGNPSCSYESSSFPGGKKTLSDLSVTWPKAPYTPSNTSWTGTSPLQRWYLRSPLRRSPPWPLGERWSGNLQLDLKLGEYVGILCKHIIKYMYIYVNFNATCQIPFDCCQGFMMWCHPPPSQFRWLKGHETARRIGKRREAAP